MIELNVVRLALLLFLRMRYAIADLLSCQSLSFILLWSQQEHSFQNYTRRLNSLISNVMSVKMNTYNIVVYTLLLTLCLVFSA